jgi:hypothetical protein
MKVLRVYLLIILFIFALAFNAKAKELQESKPKEIPLELIEAIEKGEVTFINIEILGKDKIKLTVKGKKGLRVLVPKGKIMLGFIKDNKIITRGSALKMKFTSEGTVRKHYIRVGSYDLKNSSGLSLIMDEPLSISIPEDKTNVEILGKGRINIDIPWGFFDFELAGAQGIMKTGDVTIEINEKKGKDEPKFIIKLPTTVTIKPR